MKKAFTLVELIFVIVIIGILAAAAIPQFVNLKQSAEANNAIKTTIDGASSAISAAVNYRDLEDNVTYQLDDLVAINGKGWVPSAMAAQAGVYTFYSNPPTNDKTVASITLSANSVIYIIDCDEFVDTESKKKCNKGIGLAETSTTALTVTLPY